MLDTDQPACEASTSTAALSNGSFVGSSSSSSNVDATLKYPYYQDGPLRKVHPYNHTYLTYAKARWIGREILEIFSTEFRDRSKDFYQWAINTGTVMVNGTVVDETYVIKNGDLISNVMHRHEPPILGGRVAVYHKDEENGIWVVEKKASMPIHSTGRYRKNTLLEVLKNEYGLEHVHTANRLDRLVSGLMLISTNTSAAQKLGKVFQTPGAVKKEYVARVVGEFPDEEVTCDAPLLTIDKQIGVNVVHPDGRPSKTIFTRVSFDSFSNTSVVRCRPITGRSHQLRVHLQYLGHPIANDPIYGDEVAWGATRGKGGLFPGPCRPASEEQAQSVQRAAQVLSASLEKYDLDSPYMDSSGDNTPASSVESPAPASRFKQLPVVRKDKQNREDWKLRHPDFNTRKGASLFVQDTLDSGSEVSLVPEAVRAITHLRKVRDEEDDFARYRDMERPVAPPKEIFQPKIDRNGRMTPNRGAKMLSNKEREALAEQVPTPELAKLQQENPDFYISGDDSGRYCNVCGTPLLPDHKPEQLSIWLHAMRYYTDEWDYSSPMPEWAREDWKA